MRFGVVVEAIGIYEVLCAKEKEYHQNRRVKSLYLQVLFLKKRVQLFCKRFGESSETDEGIEFAQEILLSEMVSLSREAFVHIQTRFLSFDFFTSSS